MSRDLQVEALGILHAAANREPLPLQEARDFALAVGVHSGSIDFASMLSRGNP